MIYPIYDQGGFYAGDPKSYDDRGGELCDIIEEIQSYNDFKQKSFNFESYLNSNIDY